MSLTAWWTLVTRYEDAISDRPVAGDTFAHLFINDEARAVAEQFRSLTVTNVSLPVRHRLIDDRLAAELARDPALRVVVVGCGFDSRAYRLAGGHWVEVDEPGLLAYKESRLPSSDAGNELVRVPIRFGRESLEEKLAPYATAKRAVVVLEGIFGYLSDGERRELLTSLTRLFRHHIVFCDLLTRTFVSRYSRKLVRRLRELGAEFASPTDTPETLFHDLGYRTVDRVSVILSAAEIGPHGAPPAWLVRRLPSMRDGYCVWALEYSSE